MLPSNHRMIDLNLALRTFMLPNGDRKRTNPVEMRFPAPRLTAEQGPIKQRLRDKRRRSEKTLEPSTNRCFDAPDLRQHRGRPAAGASETWGERFLIAAW